MTTSAIFNDARRGLGCEDLAIKHGITRARAWAIVRGVEAERLARIAKPHTTLHSGLCRSTADTSR